MADSWEDHAADEAPKPAGTRLNPNAAAFSFNPGASTFVPGGFNAQPPPGFPTPQFQAPAAPAAVASPPIPSPPPPAAAAPPSPPPAEANGASSAAAMEEDASPVAEAGTKAAGVSGWCMHGWFDTCGCVAIPVCVLHTRVYALHCTHKTHR